MATRPSREGTAPRVVKQLLSQVDKLFLHLDGFDHVPRWARGENIQASLFPKGSALGAGGKLDVYDHAAPEDLILVVDDDVRLPRTLIKVLQRAVDNRAGPALFGFHGSRLLPPVNSYLRNREVFQLESKLSHVEEVDVVATCVAAFVKTDLTPMRNSWRLRNAVDLQLSLDAERQGVARFLLPRQRKWLSFRDEFQPDSIYRRLVENDEQQTLLAQELLALSSTTVKRNP